MNLNFCTSTPLLSLSNICTIISIKDLDCSKIQKDSKQHRVGNRDTCFPIFVIEMLKRVQVSKKNSMRRTKLFLGALLSSKKHIYQRSLHGKLHRKKKRY